MPKRHDNIIYKLFFRSKIIKVTPSSITRNGLIICIKDPKEAFSINYIYIEEDTKVKETTIVDIIITSHPIRSDIVFVINWNTS